MTAPYDVYPQPQAQPNVVPFQTGLPQPQILGQNHVPSGSFVPSSNALQAYFPIYVLSRHSGRAWIIPVFLPVGKTTCQINFEYDQLALTPGVRSIGYRGQLPSGRQITVTDISNTPILLVYANAVLQSSRAIAPVLSAAKEFTITINSNQNFSQGDAVILYQEEQLPFTNY